MAKCSSLYGILFLLFTSGALMAMVAGESCKDDLGVCPPKDGCKSKCSKLHQGGQGICEANHCMCSYDCKTCEVALPSLGCVVDQCISDCVAKFPGKGATGFCVNFGLPNNICHCQYHC